MHNELKSFRKGELHIHLNGLFSTDVIREVIRDESPTIPEDFEVESHLNIIEPQNNLIEYLKPWDVLRLIPKKIENFSKLVDSAFSNLKDDNIEFVELRSTLIYLSYLFGKTLQETLEIVLDILTVASIKYKIKFGLIFTISRGEFSQNHLTQLLECYKNLGCPAKVIGLDLAGNEDYRVSSELSKIFLNAKERFNLKVTIHAGETGKPENILDAVLNYGADRIGHGTSILKLEKAIDIVVKNEICLEVCPISNLLTNSNEFNDEHPCLHFKNNNIPFVICSDNPSIHKRSLSDDYVFLYKQGLSIDVIKEMFIMQKKYSFL